MFYPLPWKVQMNQLSITTMSVVSSIDLFKNLIMNQKDLDNILEIHNDTKKYSDRVLFLSVVFQAILDATKPKTNEESTSITMLRDEATSWFFASIGVTSQNFQFICDYAGLKPKRVREFVSYVINSKNPEEIRSKLNSILKRK
jgi:hypothetical protein